MKPNQLTILAPWIVCTSLLASLPTLHADTSSNPCAGLDANAKQICTQRLDSKHATETQNQNASRAKYQQIATDQQQRAAQADSSSSSENNSPKPDPRAPRQPIPQWFNDPQKDGSQGKQPSAEPSHNQGANTPYQTHQSAPTRPQAQPASTVQQPASAPHHETPKQDDTSSEPAGGGFQINYH